MTPTQLFFNISKKNCNLLKMYNIGDPNSIKVIIIGKENDNPEFLIKHPLQKLPYFRHHVIIKRLEQLYTVRAHSYKYYCNMHSKSAFLEWNFSSILHLQGKEIRKCRHLSDSCSIRELRSSYVW